MQSTSSSTLLWFRRCSAVLATLMLSLSLSGAPKPAPAAAGELAKTTATLSPDGGRLVIDVQGIPPAAPLFFTARADQTVRVSPRELSGEIKLSLAVLQGRPEVFSLALSGDGEVVEVTGKGLRDWSVRQVAPGQRRLDLRPVLAETGPVPPSLDVVVRTRLKEPALPGAATLLVLSGGDAVSFQGNLTVQSDPAVDLRVTTAQGVVGVQEERPAAGLQRFVIVGAAKLEARLTQRGAALPDAELVGAQLAGKLAASGKSVEFRLRGQLLARKAGARLTLLSGAAGLTDSSVGDGWHVEVVPAANNTAVYELVADREGQFGLDLPFATAVRENAEWNALDFSMPAGAVVPILIDGLAKEVTFRPDSAAVPFTTPQGWQGFLPPTGAASLAWKYTRKAQDGALFFTTTEKTDVRVGAGLLRQFASLEVQVLQGKLGQLRCRLEGPGEILRVEAANLAGWKVVSDGSARFLELQFSRPTEGSISLRIVSQADLGKFPVRATPLRLVPEGVVRHSGFVRVANEGAVRLELADVTGMMQLAPGQFPGEAAEDTARQVFVYRFPSGTYGYAVLASQIQAEVAVSQITTYHLVETDRVISAQLELDIREAPLRDWTLLVPDDYTVVAVQGNGVTDYIVESGANAGYRPVKVVFGDEVEGRQLVELRLEKNQPAAAGNWTLRPLVFPSAKSVRGHVGAVAVAGYRIVPSSVEHMVEVPLSYFPVQVVGLQQAWRLREPTWSAEVKIEALGQSVQADVFHLYSIKQNVVHGSVLLNYFVVGAPATEWRIAVPASAGNIDVVGQNVRRDWRREGDEVIVSLHQPVLGAATLLVTFEQPMSARGGVLQPGQVRPLNVQAERGYVQVVSPFQVKHDVRKSEGGLLKLEPLELPAEFRLLSSSPSLALFQYTARPFGLEVGVEWYAQGETVDQVVDFAKLTSQISRDGQVVTDARYFVKTRGRKALRLVLPAGVKLWEARVDGEFVSARVDGEQTLLPLPARLNPNEPVAVTLRLGQPGAGEDAPVQLAAPKLQASAVISEWTLKADAGRQLVPRGGNAELIHPALTETGFEWVAVRGRVATCVLLAVVLLAALSLRQPWGWRLAVGLTLCAVAMGIAGLVAGKASEIRRQNHAQLTYSATLVPAAETVTIEVGNVSPRRASIVVWGLGAAAVGVGLLVVGVIKRRRASEDSADENTEPVRDRLNPAILVGGLTLLAAGVLAQRGGAPWFYVGIGAAVLLLMVLPGIVRWNRERLTPLDVPPPEPPPAGPGLSNVASLLFLATLIGLGVVGGASRAQADTRPALAIVESGRGAQSIIQNWSIREERLFADVSITVRGAPGDSFVLLRPPASLTDFKSDGLRVAKITRDGQPLYVVTPEREGVLTATARFEMPVSLGAAIVLPTGPAAAQRVTILLDQPGWEFASPAAVQVARSTGLAANQSGATLVLAPSAVVEIQLRSRDRDPASEATQFFAEVDNLFVPGPGGVNGYCRVALRPVQGRVTELQLEVPAGFTVGDVRGPVGSWRFDPAQRRLRVAVEPAKTELFHLEVEMQLGAGALPFDAKLEPLRVIGATGDVGKVALAFGADAQPEAVRATDLSPVNLQDFSEELIPKAEEDDEPIATVQQVWRYGQTGGRVELKIAAVEPEVRVNTRQVMSLDDDRLVMSVDLRVAITRTGLFKLSAILPEGLEVEALSGPQLSHWTEAQDGKNRVVTLHLNGRTLGEHTFTATLAGAAPRASGSWTVPKLVLREATRQSGEVLVVPGKGLQLRAVERERVTPLDPRTLGGVQPGTLAFRILQEDWTLRLGIEALDAWTTVQSLQEITVREGQTLARIAARFRVENAVVKVMRVRLPGLSEDRVRTVRATGSAVNEMVKVAGEADLWEIRFQRGIIGDTDVQIEYQGPAVGAQEREQIAPPEFPDARQVTQFVAVRGGGRLELDAGELPRGWTRTDWSAVPALLQSGSDRSVPALSYRVAETESPLSVAVRRHATAEALKLRVTQGDLTTLFSAKGAFLTAVDLKVDVLEKGTLRVRLPEGARLFNTLVNSENITAMREGDAYLFHVTPSSETSRTAAVRLVYSAPGHAKSDISLIGPSLSVPLENVTWRVVIPAGYELKDYDGELRLRQDFQSSWLGVEQYQSMVESKRTAEAKKAVALLQEANSYLQQGDQQKAGEVLSRASNTAALDEASNEDARVQLRNLKTQQTVLGLNTRRQRLYLDNRIDAARNEQLEQAASLNPYMQGKLNFDPAQVDQLMQGNTVEENTALKGIAARLVDQQLAAEPAPGAIDVVVPERGRVLTFTRSLQVDGAAPLQLDLEIRRAATRGYLFGAIVLLIVATITSLSLRWNRE